MVSFINFNKDLIDYVLYNKAKFRKNCLKLRDLFIKQILKFENLNNLSKRILSQKNL